MIRAMKWSVPVIATLAFVGLGLPALAQHAGGGEPNDVKRGKEIAQLVQQGQLKLADATALAERHVKGTAMEASCELLVGDTAPAAPGKPDKPEKPGGPSADTARPMDGSKLMYEVACFADEKIQLVKVDGQTKKVVDVKERK